MRRSRDPAFLTAVAVVFGVAFTLGVCYTRFVDIPGPNRCNGAQSAAHAHLPSSSGAPTPAPGLPPPPPGQQEGVTFAKAFEASGTDKFSNHGYHRYYDEFLGHLRSQKVRLLEIGVMKGQSLRAWKRVFSRDSTVYGMAYSGKAGADSDAQGDLSLPSENIFVFRADQSNCTDLAHVRESIGAGTLDVIIDDGSHAPSHMVKSLGALFPLLRPGGCYVLEDTECSYWDKPGAAAYGYELPGVGVGRPGSLISLVKLLVEVLNQKFSNPAYEPSFHVLSPEVDPLVSYITVAQNMVILKKSDSEDAKFQRPPALMYSDGSSWNEFFASAPVQATIKQARAWLCG